MKLEGSVGILIVEGNEFSYHGNIQDYLRLLTSALLFISPYVCIQTRFSC